MPIELDAADAEATEPKTPEVEQPQPAAEPAEPWGDEIFSGPDEEPQGDKQLLADNPSGTTSSWSAEVTIEQQPDVIKNQLRNAWQEYRYAVRQLGIFEAELEKARAECKKAEAVFYTFLDKILFSNDPPPADKPQEELTIGQMNLSVGIRRILESNFRTFADLDDYFRLHQTFARLKGVGEKKSEVIEKEYGRILGERNEQS